MNSSDYQAPDRQIQEIARTLGLADEAKRLQARRSLEIAGKKAVPVLLEALFKGNRLARREAAGALVTIREPSTAPALVCTLEDPDHDVRWRAMNALVALDQAGLETLLLALMKDFTSVYLMEGARHVLNELKDKHRLKAPFLKVLEAFKGIQPAVTVPWAAEKVWEELYMIPGKKSDNLK